MRGVKSALFDGPGRSRVATDTKTYGRRSYHDVGPGWMRTDLMNISIDVDRGVPGQASISRARNSAHMDVGEKYGAIASRRDGPDSKRRPQELAVHDRRTRIPFFAAFDGVKTVKTLLCAVRINPQDMRVIRSDKYGGSDCDGA